MKRPRIIPALLIDGGRLVKTIKFRNPIYLGDPVNAIKIFNEKEVDELCIMDISASEQGREPDFELLRNMASEAFMPLSYAGGIRSIDQMRKLFRAGYEKVVVNTAFAENKNIIREAADTFGSQSIVCSIDYKKDLFGMHCYINDGSRRIKQDPVEMAIEAEMAGAGEIILYCMDNDGCRCGYDLATINAVSERTGIPLIACGGADSLGDIKNALDSGASAVAAGSMFVFFGKKQAVLINYPAEQELTDLGIYSK